MDARRTPPRPGESGPSLVRPEPPAARPGNDVPPADPPRPGKPIYHWRRLTRTRQGAVGVAILAAALLLWPFSGWFWIPWVAGLAVLVLVAVLRLDRVLHGWAGHLAGLAVAAGLMLVTGPWDWAVALALGVLLAGLVQLPRLRLIAVGAVLSVLAGTGWGVDHYLQGRERAAQDAERSRENVTQLGERSPDRVLPALLEGIGQGDAVGVCGLLAEAARNRFTAAAGTPDCASAVAHFHAAQPTVPPLRNLDAPVVGSTVDACRTPWASSRLGGPELGVLQVAQAPPPGATFFVNDFSPCGDG